MMLSMLERQKDRYGKAAFHKYGKSKYSISYILFVSNTKNMQEEEVIDKLNIIEARGSSLRLI